jgi:SOS-response transcriptional repressor LexA
MYRGIKGTFLYACNPGLREYLKEHIESYKNKIPFRILRDEEVKPYINSIPLVDISAAAGNFSGLQSHAELTWIEPPFNISAKKGYFVCRVVGESMNKRIPHGSYCLFKQDEGGSRNGKIVLVESTSINDSEFGSGYTVKEYHSTKNVSDEGWKHEIIRLRRIRPTNYIFFVDRTGLSFARK